MRNAEEVIIRCRSNGQAKIFQKHMKALSPTTGYYSKMSSIYTVKQYFKTLLVITYQSRERFELSWNMRLYFYRTLTKYA